MGFFEKFKPKRTAESDRFIGRAVIQTEVSQPTPEPEQAPRLNYAQEIDARQSTLHSKQKAFMRAARESGLQGTELKTAVAGAMMNGELPTIINGMSYRGGGFHLIFLSGQLRPEHIEAEVAPANPDRPDDVSYTIYIADDISKDPDIRVESSPRLPQHENPSRFPYDQGILDKIDVHMQGYVENTPDTAMPKPVKIPQPYRAPDDFII